MRAFDEKIMDGYWAGGMTSEPLDTACLYVDFNGSGYTGSAVFYSSDSMRYSIFHLNFGMLDADGHGVGVGHHVRTFNDFFFKSNLVTAISGFIGTFMPDLGVMYTRPPIDLALKIHLEGPQKLNMEISVDGVVHATTSLGRARYSKNVSAIARVPISWSEYKNQSVDWVNAAMLFRGQRNHWPLRSSLHRRRRFDMLRYSIQDIPGHDARFRDMVGRPANFGVVQDLQTAMGLAQHYGEYSSVLDWSRSPMVAAYFACREALLYDGNPTSPTIFVFDAVNWKRTVPEMRYVIDMRPWTALMEPPSEGNERLKAQCGVIMHCNADSFEMRIDIEATYRKTTYLRCFELIEDPIFVMRELRTMGISGATMFPDDTGKELDAAEEKALR